MRCIEIGESIAPIGKLIMININMRCIEICQYPAFRILPLMININMRCIEISLAHKDKKK